MIPETLRNFKAEKALLGLLLREKDALHNIMKARISSELFCSPVYKGVFEVISDIYSQGKAVDLVAVGTAIQGTELAQDLFKGAELIDIYDDSPIAHNPFDYVKIIQDCHVRRLAWYESHRWIKALEHPATDVFTHLTEVERKATELVNVLLATTDKDDDSVAYRKFPMEVFPEGLAKFLEGAAESFPVDPGYLVMPALVTFSACMGTGRRVQCKQGWYEPPLLWGALIAEPSSLKTPATKAILKPLGSIELELHEENESFRKSYEQELAEWKMNGNGLKGKKAVAHLGDMPEPPKENRLLVQDCTLEAMATLMADNPRGMCLYRNELGSWLRGFGKYSKGNGDSGEMNEWCEYWDCMAGMIDRKHGTPKRIHVPNKAAAVFGTIPPEVIAACATDDKFDSGFFGRILFMMPPKRLEQWTDVCIDPADMEGWISECKKAFYDDVGVRDGNEYRFKIVPMTASAQKIWIDWYNAWGQRLWTSQGEVLFGLGKLKGYAGRLALLLAGFEYHWQQRREIMVNQTHVKNAITMIEWFSREMIRVYKMVTTPKQKRKEERLESWIRTQDGKVSIRKLQMSNPTRFTTSKDAEQALEALVRAGKGRWVTRAPEGPGRPSREFHLELGQEATNGKHAG